jgi:hypothetical protein
MNLKLCWYVDMDDEETRRVLKMELCEFGG